MLGKIKDDSGRNEGCWKGECSALMYFSSSDEKKEEVMGGQEAKTCGWFEVHVATSE
jgi:hypothetical protein